MTVGERIKELRKKEDLSQQQFADMLGLSHPSISLFETGKSGVSNATLVAISRTFHVRKEWLETGEGEMYEFTHAESLVPELKTVLENNPAILRLTKAVAEHMTLEDWKRLNDFIDTLGVK